MVSEDGAVPLPWLAEPLRITLATQRAHALLVHGPEGIGQFELALSLAQGWLCEAEQGARRPCGRCASCRLVRARSHPDLMTLIPEALRESLGWESGEADTASGADKSKAKPSKEIKVDAVRRAVGFAQTTSARGRGKVVVLHPAERMNGISANTLLKTLEDPPGNSRFVLSCATPDALLPTIRSRCQAVRLSIPPAADACAWLEQRGVENPHVILAAAGGQPLDALAWIAQGVDSTFWPRLPALVARGDAGAAVAAWPLPRLIDALQKLCHDAACLAAGGAPRYFPPGVISPGADPQRLVAWSQALLRAARHADHPWSAGLMAESLWDQARRALDAEPARPPKRTNSVDSCA